MSKDPICITEYQSFTADRRFADGVRFQYLEPGVFDELEKFIISNKGDDVEAIELMSISYKKRIGKVITAQNYVGLITLTDGTSIEILPKISRQGVSAEASKKILLQMLKSLKSFQNKTLQSSNLDIDKMPLFEIFIRMYIDEVQLLTKRGLKSDYIEAQDNLNCFKGKILFSRHIQENYIHKERAFVAYDEYSLNRPENRILKTTLEYLYKQTESPRNKKDIKTLLNYFEDIETSVNPDADFNLCKSDRNMSAYDRALLWSRIFLKDKSFTSFSGSNIAIALLFPMDALFESYIASEIRKLLKGSEFRVTVQDHRYHLYDRPSAFLLKPDIVIRSNRDGKCYIMDTKWKLLSAGAPHYGISQEDMYQMYAYQQKYKAENVTLLYPAISSIERNDIEYTSAQGDVARIRFIDMLNVKESLQNILDELA